MKVKKKDRKLASEKKSQFEQIQADHEQFLQAFEKPTHIYRYLRTRQSCNPLFLQRNLQYMRKRAVRKKTWKGAKIDHIAEKLAEKQKLNNNLFRSENLGLLFRCLCAKGNSLIDRAEVEVSLKKMPHCKRKDIPSVSSEKKIGVFSLPCTSGDGRKFSNAGEKLELNGKEFQYSNGCAVRAYSLQFNVKCRKREGDSLESGLYNGYLETEEKRLDNDSSPPPKKRKTRGHVKDNVVTNISENVRYSGFLTIFDHKHRKLLKDGDYEVILYGDDTMNGRLPSWEPAERQENQVFEAFSTNPTIKFQVSWERNNDDDMLPSPDKDMAVEQLNNNVDDACKSHSISLITTNNTSTQEKRIFYHFLYNNNTRQQTEARGDLFCPWCQINCCELYSLLKHLRTTHARFNFLYSEHPKGARIDVTVNPHYDGSYVGNPQDLQSHIGFAFSRLGAVRRTAVTQLLVYRPKKLTYDLAEFLEPETECSGIRQHITGHNRLYYHTVTLQPIRPCEIDADSEEEINPTWLKKKTINLIDEFTDVNEGEKEIMKMWNLHLMMYNFIGDVQLPKACETFVQDHGINIIKRNLSRNLTLHLGNLYDFGLIKPEVVSRTMMQLYRLRSKLESDGLLDRNFECSELGTKYLLGESSSDNSMISDSLVSSSISKFSLI